MTLTSDVWGCLGYGLKKWFSYLNFQINNLMMMDQEMTVFIIFGSLGLAVAFLEIGRCVKRINDKSIMSSFIRLTNRHI